MKNLILALALFALVPCAAQTTLTIPNNDTTSSAFVAASGLGYCTLTAIIIKAGWTGGATLTFQKSIDGVTYYPVRDQYGAAVTCPLAVNIYPLLLPSA